MKDRGNKVSNATKRAEHKAFVVWAGKKDLKGVFWVSALPSRAYNMTCPRASEEIIYLQLESICKSRLVKSTRKPEIGRRSSTLHIVAVKSCLLAEIMKCLPLKTRKPATNAERTFTSWIRQNTPYPMLSLSERKIHIEDKSHRKYDHDQINGRVHNKSNPLRPDINRRSPSSKAHLLSKLLQHSHTANLTHCSWVGHR